ncbi:DNA repair protein RecN [Cycloclasticus pugetii]|uniref:DNA repair protein RecN n=1 Tax=Cycloclasticus pugetii TaxID=34068 RepID=UPI000918EB0E|nr:DNA repair protein RecN [Cycloclasticus pugetii]SHI44185.1 DNA replication and repair protein RecN [Cycloclasticus pugetii]
MLKSIDIKGLAVVDQLNLELEQGMTVLTGETGAGKSILLTAMKLCLGERADASLLRPGANKADLSLEFDITDLPASQQWLIDNDLDDEGDCFIRRTINADGRSKAYINGQAVNLKALQQLSKHLINIHGQHAHLDLLHPGKQCELVDSSLPSQALLLECRKQYSHWKRLTEELHHLTDGNEDNESEKQLLKYQINELEQANIIHIDYDELVQEHALASNMRKIIETSAHQIDILYENENASIYGQINNVSHELELLADLAPEFTSVGEQIKEASIQIQEASRDLRHQIDQQEDDPEKLSLLDQQLSSIHELARKLHVEPSQLSDKYTQLTARLDLLENRNEKLSALQLDIAEAETLYRKQAELLHNERKQHALKLSRNITNTLKTLGLPDGKLNINVNHLAKQPPQKNGLDDVIFLISTNPGMPDSPIGKVASGGELSRISLAIQVVTSRRNTTPTLVFDEVDAGIGGGVAETVGIRLRELACDRQVLCVTHLPQVASQGHQHLLVSKQKSQQQTKTKIDSLNQTQRINEVARMLGGIDLSDKTIAHAKEMVEKAI